MVFRLKTKRKPKRAYVSPRRQEGAQGTRRAVRRAASELFLEKGYGATTMTEIAARARVAPKTVYLAFPTKAELLAEIIGAAVGGDDERIPLSQRPWFRTIQRGTASQLLEGLAENATAIHSRAAAIQAVGEAAADGDPRLAAMRDGGRHSRREDMRLLARTLMRARQRSDLDINQVTDLLYVLTSWQSFMLLTRDCGWPVERYRAWLENSLRSALLPTKARGTTP